MKKKQGMNRSESNHTFLMGLEFRNFILISIFHLLENISDTLVNSNVPFKIHMKSLSHSMFQPHAERERERERCSSPFVLHKTKLSLLKKMCCKKASNYHSNLERQSLTERYG